MKGEKEKRGREGEDERGSTDGRDRLRKEEQGLREWVKRKGKECLGREMEGLKERRQGRERGGGRDWGQEGKAEESRD